MCLIELHLDCARQEFGVIHTHRLGRVREGFAAQCSAARKRNQDMVETLRQVGTAVTRVSAVVYATVKRPLKNMRCNLNWVLFRDNDIVLADILVE